MVGAQIRFDHSYQNVGLGHKVKSILTSKPLQFMYAPNKHQDIDKVATQSAS